MEWTACIPRPGLPGWTVTILVPSHCASHAGIRSSVAPPGSAWWCRGGTSAPAAKARRSAGINRPNGSAAAVAAASRDCISRAIPHRAGHPGARRTTAGPCRHSSGPPGAAPHASRPGTSLRRS